MLYSPPLLVVSALLALQLQLLRPLPFNLITKNVLQGIAAETTKQKEEKRKNLSPRNRKALCFD
jgi:hypothetical protein